jgi:tetratricopeptide (TPR) repeat protein
MKDSADLYDLIKALSPNEKRAISLSISNSPGENNPAYLKLFRALDKQNKYDPEKLKSSLKNEDFVSYLPVLKNYLYNLILKNLRNFTSGSTFNNGLFETLIEINLLFHKGLFIQADKKLQKLKREAQQKEKFEILALCYQWDTRLIPSIPTPATSKSIWENELEVNKKASELASYKYLILEYREFMFKNGPIRGKGQEKWIKDFLNNPLLKDTHKASSLRSGLHYHTIRSYCYFELKNYSKGINCLDSALEIFEKIVPHDRSFFVEYTSFYCNKILYLIWSGKYDEALATLNEVKQIPKKAKANKWGYKITGLILADLQYKCIDREMAIYFNSGRYRNYLNLIPEKENLISQTGYSPQKYLNITRNYQTAYVYFIMGNYKETLNYLQKILNYTKEETLIREDIYCVAKILLLITHYELKTHDFLKYTLRSTYRFLSQRKRVYTVEKTFLEFIKNEFLKTSPSKSLVKEFTELKNKLEKITRDPYEQNILRHFDFIAWLDSKISGKKFSAVMEEKYFVPLKIDD